MRRLDSGEARVEALERKSQSLVVEPERVQQSRVEIAHTHFVDDGAVTDLVGFPMVDAAFYSAAGEPGGEGVGVVIATGLRPFL